MKGGNSEEEEIKIPKCSIKSHVETINEEMKESSSEEEERKRLEYVSIGEEIELIM